MSDPDDGLTLTVLGCDGSWPGPDGAGSGYLVRSPTTSLVLDAGPGTFAVLQTVLDPADIDAVVVTHEHTDHWTDLYAYDHHARFAIGRRGLPVHAPAGVARRAATSGTPALDWHVVADGDRVVVGDLTCTFHRTDHPVDTLAVRVAGAGRTLGYSADTGPGWPVAALGEGLDLLLCEATYDSTHHGTAGHLSAGDAGGRARAAGARRLVVTHRWPTVPAERVAAEAAAAFGRPVEQAATRREFRL